MKRTQDTLELKMMEQARQNVVDSFSSQVSEEATAQFASHPFESGVPSEESKFSDTLSSVITEFSGSPVFKPASPSIPTTSWSLPELMPNLSTELMSVTPCVSPQDSKRVKMIKDLNSKENLSQCSHSQFGQSSEKPEPEVNSPLCSTLLSPLSVEGSCEYSPASQKALNCHDLYNSKTCLSSAETSPVPSYSPLPSPLSQQRGSETSLKARHKYSEAELDDFIATIVSGHKMTVEDSNSITDEVLQEMFRECKVSICLTLSFFRVCLIPLPRH